MKLKNTFEQGKMNKDIDERLLPKGQYSHAENIRVINSDGSDIGAIENVKGNKNLTSFSLTNAKTIGSFVDTTNQKIYWFTTSDEKDLVVEYHYPTRVTSILLEDTRGILNFSEDFLITGVVKTYNEDFKKDLLIWTDDRNLPRSINIERAKKYGADGFSEDQITLSKAPPLDAPTYRFTFDTRSSQNSISDKFLAFATRFKYADGGISALSPFSYYAFSPTELDIDNDTLENKGMINNFNALDITFDSGNSEVIEVELVFKESGSNSVYAIQSFNKQNTVIPDNKPFTFRFINDKIYSPLAEDELFRLYDNVPNKAKALEFVGNRLVFGNYEEGFDIVDETNRSIDINYNVEILSNPIESIDIPFSILNDGEQLNIDFSDIEIKNGVRLSFRFFLEEYDDQGNRLVDSSYTGTVEYIVNDDVNTPQELFETSDFNFFLNSTLVESFDAQAVKTPPAEDIAPSVDIGYTYIFSEDVLILQSPKTDYTIDTTPNDSTDNPDSFDTLRYSWRFTPLIDISSSTTGVLSSVKSLRNYELGLVYVFPYGKTSTVLTSRTNTVSVDILQSVNKNQFRVTIDSKPPKDAIAYRFAVKQTQGTYYNIFATQFFEDGRFFWVKLEGSDKDKVSVGQTLYVKSDTSGVINQVVETTVLEVVNQPTNFISDNSVNTATGEVSQGDGAGGNGTVQLVESSGVYMKLKPQGFNVAYDNYTYNEFDDWQGLDENKPSVTLRLERDGQPFPVRKDARITFDFAGNKQFKKQSDLQYSYKKSYIASRDYDNIQEWYSTEVGFGELRPQKSNKEGDNIVITTSPRENGTFNVATSVSGSGKKNTSVIFAKITVRNTNNIIVFETKPKNNNNALFYETAETFRIVNGNHQGNVSNQLNGSAAVSVLNWYNTFALGQGVESIYYLDGFNNNFLNIDLRPNTVSLERYSKVRRFADLTYSEPYNENTNINGLSEFNLSRANFKDDIDKKYGFIQKLHTRNSDLIVFQEDKVHKVLFGKDLLFNSDGTTNVTSIDEVLGQHIGYAGEFGISKNPESFSYDANNLYFTDAKRGSVLRLGNNGITEISNYGMRRYFKTEFRDSLDNKKVGAFDPFHEQYVLNLSNQTLSVPINISCGQVFRQSNFTGKLTHSLELGVQQGQTGVSFTTNGVPLTVSIVYNDTIYTSGLITDTQVHSINFDKQSSLPSNATLIIESSSCGASIELTNNCVVSSLISVVSIILNDDNDKGLERISRYKWVNGGYDSGYKTFNSVFEEGSNIVVDGLDGKIDVFDVNTGQQGIGFLPIESSGLLLESIKSPNNPATFIDGNRIGYLVSNNEYTESQIQEVVDNATFPEPTEGIEINGEPTLSTSFNLPITNNRYVYLIWDYINSTVPPCNSGMDVVFIFDYTASMGGQINSAKSGVLGIIETIKQQSSPNDYRLGLVIADEVTSQTTSQYSSQNAYTELPNEQKIVNEGQNGKYQWITSIVPLETNNETKFEQGLNLLNNPTNGLNLGQGVSGPEPMDLALSKVIEENFSNPLRPNIARYVVMITDASPSGDDDSFTIDDINEVDRLANICVQNNIKVIVLGTGVSQGLGGVFPWRNLADVTGGSWNASFDADVVRDEIANNCTI